MKRMTSGWLHRWESAPRPCNRGKSSNSKCQQFVLILGQMRGWIWLSMPVSEFKDNAPSHLAMWVSSCNPLNGECSANSAATVGKHRLLQPFPPGKWWRFPGRRNIEQTTLREPRCVFKRFGARAMCPTSCALRHSTLITGRRAKLPTMRCNSWPSTASALVHWSDQVGTQHLRQSAAPWDAYGQEVVNIYFANISTLTEGIKVMTTGRVCLLLFVQKGN